MSLRIRLVVVLLLLIAVAGAQSKSPNDQERVVDPYPVEISYLVKSVSIDSFNWLMKGDEIRISTKKGLHHFRNGKLWNTYKIIPKKVKEEYNSDCPEPPCQSQTRERIFYFLEPLKKYIVIEPADTDYSFKLSKQNFTDGKDGISFKKGDMVQHFLLRKR